MKKTRLLFLLAIPFSCLGASCKANPQITTTIRSVTLPAFGNVDFDLTHQEFVNAGFNYNDLIEVTFHDYDGSGDDISYEVAYVTNYNEVGYYCPCLCNYEGKSEHFDFAFGMSHLKNNSPFLIGRKATFKMKEKGGYARVRDLVEVSRKLSYEELSGDNNAFANFRDVTSVGNIIKNIAPKRLYRGSSPYNSHSNPDGRHDVCDKFLKECGINTEVALTGTKSEIELQINTRALEDDKSQTVKLYKESLEHTELKDMSFYSEDLGTDYFTIEANNNGIVIGGGDLCRNIFNYIAERCNGETEPAPIFVHCNEGKDRTGFFVMILEALAGVSLEDIVNDFMLTFKNYYNVSRPDNVTKYDTLANLTIYRHIYSILVEDPAQELESIDWYHFDTKSEVEKKLNEGATMQIAANNYLEKIIRLNPTNIKAIHDWISNEN